MKESGNDGTVEDPGGRFPVTMNLKKRKPRAKTLSTRYLMKYYRANPSQAVLHLQIERITINHLYSAKW